MIQQRKRQDRIFQKEEKLTTINFDGFCEENKKFLDCLLILNSKTDKKWLDLIIKNTQVIILVDGGANHFYQSTHRDQKNVKYIMGDLDSIKTNVMEYYKGRSVQVYELQDQNYTDFQKSLMKAQELGLNSFVCFGALGGRLDHTFSSLHTATKFGRQNQLIQMILIGDQNLMVYLRPDIRYKIKINKLINKHGCGLITFSKIDKIQTKGFKWDLGPTCFFDSLEWGKFISTSNEIVQDQLTIYSSHQLFFVCCLANNS